MLITINLLPASQKHRKFEKKTNGIIFTICFIIFSVLVASSILLYTYDNIQKNEQSTFKSQLSNEQENLNQYKDTSQSIAQISNTLKYIDILAQKSINWEKFLTQFNSLIPEKTQITSLKVSTVPSSIIDISGQAESRRDVIKLYEKMKTTKFFQDPEIKSLDKSSVEKSTGFQFSISAKILLEKL